MGVAGLFVLAFLTAQVSCGRNSLTFVIDDTASMWNDIQQVKNAAKSIVDIVLKEKATQIEDIVLVTFNDPSIKFRKRTRDENELKQALDSISVHGGGDCPEMALSGIKQALEESQPGSYLFVFTDASARDYRKFEEIKTLCQEKQSQIVIVLTGSCLYDPREGHEVYHKIAAASNGQVFRIDKNEVGQVLEYVKETIKGDRTVITSVIVPANDWRYVKFNIDDQTEYAVVSASGNNVELYVLDQDNRFINSGKSITWTKNVKVLKLTGLTTGTYTVKVRGNSEVNIMIFGRTDFTFDHGFSTKVETSLRTTETQPTTDVKTHLMISVKDPEHSANIQHVELLDMKEKVITTLPLTRVEGDVYATEKFLSPENTFKIAVVATARNSGKIVKRIAKTPVTPIKPVLVAPEISKTDDHLKVHEGASIDVHCRIRKGKPKPQITWHLKKQGAAGFQQLGDQDDVLHVTNVLTNDHYKCVAQNSVGRDEHTVQLDVQARPEFENTPAVITKKEGEPVTIECKLRRGNPRPGRVIWQFKPKDGATYTTMRYDGEVLRIAAARVENAGIYQCIAENAEGRGEKTTTLEIQVAPEISKTHNFIRVREGASTDLYCRVLKGKSMSQIKWYLKKQGASDFQQLSGKTEEVLHVTNAVTNDHYKCVVENNVGRDEHTVQLDVLVRPEFEDTPPVITKNDGEPVTIECKLRKGNPRPRGIIWQFKSKDAATYSTMRHEGEVLQISAARVDQAGDYKCIVENAEGRREKTTTLVVNVAPEISKTHNFIRVREGASTDLYCRVLKGKSMSQIKWYLKKQGASDFQQLSGKTEEVLHVTNAVTNDHYKCVVENNVGRDEHTVQLDVLVRPEFEDTPPVITKNDGEPVTIECKLRKGNPRPKGIIWQFKPKDAATYSTMRHEGEVLQISAARVDQAGDYKCIVENAEGRREKTTTLVVNAKPVMEKPLPTLTAMENTTATLQCRVTAGFPRPIVQWYYKGPHSREYVKHSENNGVLRIENIQLGNAGQYKCVAVNTVGQTERDVQVIVTAPPRIVSNSHIYNGVEGDVVMKLPCNAVGYPTPVITWVVDSQIIGSEKSNELYTKDNALFLQNPKREHSTDKGHTYACRARNDFGEASQPYEVYITKYADVGKRNETYGMHKQPYDLQCPLPYTDPSSVRWFKNSVSLNKTGPALHFDAPTLSDSGNYTCRVSDLTGAVSHTVELIFGYPPIRSNNQLAFNITWQGDHTSIDCSTDQVPQGKYTWFYNGKEVKEKHIPSLALTGWGDYTCKVTNPFGSLEVKYHVSSKDCGIPTSLLKTKHIPLILDSSLSWPALSDVGQYIMVPHSEKLNLICQDNAITKSRSTSNSFTNFPNAKTIVATCDHEESFLVDGVSRKFSELDCKDDVKYRVTRIDTPCLGDNTQLMKVGYHVNGFTEVYQSCVDMTKNVPLYTKMTTIDIERADDGIITNRSCADESKCCYENIQLVNADDVSFGPPEKTTYIDSLNTVKYCKPKSNTAWSDLEQLTRGNTLTVWSGAANYKKVGKIWTPSYLWKVLKDLDSAETVAIVHENEVTPGKKLCSGDCGESSVWFEPQGNRTYCCGLDDFKKALAININFDED